MGSAEVGVVSFTKKKFPGETIGSICFPALDMIWISSVLYGLMDGLKVLEISHDMMGRIAFAFAFFLAFMALS